MSTDSNKKSRKYFSIKQKLLGIFLLVLMIPVSLAGIYLATEIRQGLIDFKTNEIETNNERIERDFVETLTPIIRVADWVHQDEDLFELVTEEYTSNYEVYQAYQRYELFEDYLKYYPEIQHIRFYVDNPTLTNSSGIYYAEPTIASQPWYQDAVDKRGQISWIQLIDPVTGEMHFNLTRSVYRDFQLVGVLSIAVSESVFESILANSNSTVFITLDDQTPVYSYPHFNNIEDEYQKYVPTVMSLQEGNDINLQENIGKESFTLNVRHVNIPKTLQSSLKIIGVVPTNLIVAEANRDILLAYLAVILVFVLCFIFLAVFIRSFNRRIGMLKSAMSKVADNDFNIPERIDGNDEVSEVYGHLYETMQSLQHLIGENYRHLAQEKNMEIRQKETQFKALSSQINPHFLYNTLEMIRMKALRNKDKEVADIVKILSKLMRKALEGNHKELPLSEELTFTEMYLQIQQLRFGKEQVEYNITQNIKEDCMVIPLIIQPIVENSFIHGIEPKEGKGIISIDVVEYEKNVYITIKDNGVGMTPSKLQALKAILNQEDKSDRIGINNVNQRIKYFYGEEYGLDIESIYGEGTVAKITLPVLNKKGKDNENV